MFKIKKVKVVLVILFIFLTIGCSNTNDSTRNAEWIEDIDYLATNLKKQHFNLFFELSEEEYDKQVDNLKKDVPKLTDEEINYKLQEVVASVGDAHTKYYPNGEQEYFEDTKVYPIRFMWFEDELRVHSAYNEYRDLLGLKLISINDINTDEITSIMSSIISFENTEWLKLEMILELMKANTLDYLGITNKDSALFVFEDDNGEKVEKKIKTIDGYNYNEKSMISYIDTVENRLTSVYEDRFGKDYLPYWYKFISEDNIFYFRYIECWDYEENSSYPKFEEFQRELIQSVNDNIDSIDKFVLDVRYNSGGRDDFMKKLSSELKKNIGTKDIDSYVITNRGTFSSGVSAVADFKKDLNATIVGTRTGGNLSTLGNINFIESPNNKCKIQYSQNFVDSSLEYKGINGDEGIIPDIEIKESFDSFSKGIDDCYEYIKNSTK